MRRLPLGARHCGKRAASGALSATRGTHEHSGRAPAEQFWIIKHGIKFTAMPAWGKTHSDSEIWGLVAFLQKLPTLTSEQYRQMTAPADAPRHANEKHPSRMTGPREDTRQHDHHHHDARAGARHPTGTP